MSWYIFLGVHTTTVDYNLASAHPELELRASKKGAARSRDLAEESAMLFFSAGFLRCHLPFSGALLCLDGSLAIGHHHAG